MAAGVAPGDGSGNAVARAAGVPAGTGTDSSGARSATYFEVISQAVPVAGHIANDEPSIALPTKLRRQRRWPPDSLQMAGQPKPGHPV